MRAFFTGMFKICGALIPLFLAGCVLSSATELDDGRYQIDVRSSGYASYESLFAKVDRKAKKLCEGTKFIIEGDGEVEVEKTKTYENGDYVTTSVYKLTKYATCTASTASPKEVG